GCSYQRRRPLPAATWSGLVPLIRPGPPSRTGSPGQATVPGDGIDVYRRAVPDSRQVAQGRNGTAYRTTVILATRVTYPCTPMTSVDRYRAEASRQPSQLRNSSNPNISSRLSWVTRRCRLR